MPFVASIAFGAIVLNSLSVAVLIFNKKEERMHFIPKIESSLDLLDKMYIEK